MPTERRELTDLTRDLVSIPSHEDETAAGDFLDDWLRTETDATVTTDDAGNVVARKSPTGDAVSPDGGDDTSLAFVGHHDVVPPAARQQDGEAYVVEERDGDGGASWDLRADDGTPVASGVYLVRIEVEGEAPVLKKAAVIR